MRSEYNKYWYQQYRLQNSNGCSTYLFLIAFALFCLMFAGCRTKKVVTDESSTVSLIDTTKTAADSLTATHDLTDTTKTTQTEEESEVVEFVDGGGTITIDTAGNITLSGVKSYKGNRITARREERGVTIADEVSQVHNEQANGIKADESKTSHGESETKIEKPVWYQTVLAKISGLCCIAALLWALFLYLKRKF